MTARQCQQVFADCDDIGNNLVGIDGACADVGSDSYLSGQTVVDGKGMTLIPGLIDAPVEIEAIFEVQE